MPLCHFLERSTTSWWQVLYQSDTTVPRLLVDFVHDRPVITTESTAEDPQGLASPLMVHPQSVTLASTSFPSIRPPYQVCLGFPVHRSRPWSPPPRSQRTRPASHVSCEKKTRLPRPFQTAHHRAHVYPKVTPDLLAFASVVTFSFPPHNASHIVAASTKLA